MLLINAKGNEWARFSPRNTGEPLHSVSKQDDRRNIMDLDELYALLAIGAVAPYVAEAAIDWMERSPRSKSIAKFLRSQFTHLPN